MNSIRSLSSAGTSRLKLCRFSDVCQVLPCALKMGRPVSKAGLHRLTSSRGMS
ncbi:Uncharacterised protein [Vibrio cholerae]|nr:Uncharacterised protein [Vibrio cholerae]CSI49668.1 Uncharacterised protein [Vibrio cholerae]